MQGMIEPTTCPELVSDTQLARILGISAAWLRSEAENGRLPGIQAGKRFLFNVPVVERILAERASTEHAKGGDREE